MEEVPLHVHLDPIVYDVLTREHDHRFGLIWSGDRAMAIIDIQCRRFGRNLFQAYSGAPCRLIDIIDRTGILRPSAHTVGVIVSLVSQRKSKPSSAGAWFLLVVPWVALPLSMIVSRHFRCSHATSSPGARTGVWWIGHIIRASPPGTVGSSFQAPLSPAVGSSFQAPPPPPKQVHLHRICLYLMPLHLIKMSMSGRMT
ncbi:hypothetical protein M9H77_34878 [Catharanthus roseus]|uniref:Uncharacterized protein n=1 Tax=Catharanthus roseus TaxID=4058 RepID=A0ACB9ZMQ0_CATRO|nr:hypothetical protein M9H77_34878 [Catharanthus roseus]